ncbi:MAG: hypothetical protein J0L92_39870 [Deltaproteobacteria bacterium]|nr:hypothetical protein [Deltaproteobacteria bacterium]
MRHGGLTLCIAISVPTAIVLAAPDDLLPEQPSRGAIVEAMRFVSPRVAACGDVHGQHGSASLRMVFGADGHVTEVGVPTAYEGTPVGACLAEAARTAQVPPFTRPSFTVSYPFRF